MSYSSCNRTLWGSSLFILMLAGLSLADPAQARTERSALVETADLDLRHPEGQATLEHRLNYVVRQICGTADPRVIADRLDQQRCRDEALRSAQNSMVALPAS